jgi:hypothetical protein
LTSLDILDTKHKDVNSFTGVSHWFSEAYPQVTPQRMKIKQEELDRLASLLIANYRSNELINMKCDDHEIKKSIAGIIGQNFAEEAAIEEEARHTLASHARAARDMDPYKMFLLAKQKIAAKKGFIL